MGALEREGGIGEASEEGSALFGGELLWSESVTRVEEEDTSEESVSDVSKTEKRRSKLTIIEHDRSPTRLRVDQVE